MHVPFLGGIAVRDSLSQSLLLFNVVVVVVDRFYRALFSALEQIHCAHVTRDSE